MGQVIYVNFISKKLESRALEPMSLETRDRLNQHIKALELRVGRTHSIKDLYELDTELEKLHSIFKNQILLTSNSELDQALTGLRPKGFKLKLVGSNRARLLYEYEMQALEHRIDEISKSLDLCDPNKDSDIIDNLTNELDSIMETLDMSYNEAVLHEISSKRVSK